MIYEGSCHCGAIRFRVETDQREVLDCNCSICAKKGLLHLIVPESAFTLVAGAPATYTFGTHTAKHHFCGTCGAHPFYRPRSHPDAWDVNARCLDVPLSYWTITPFDGQNWEANVGSIQSDSRTRAV
ncbi:MAG: GFA family protein [Myxococcota bacterium]|nr:GFA family protein [Myxococcota bacterium]